VKRLGKSFKKKLQEKASRKSFKKKLLEKASRKSF